MATEVSDTFEIIISRTQPPYEVTATSPAADAPIRSALPVLDDWLTPDLRAILAEMAKDGSQSRKAEIQKVGEALYTALFTREIERAFFKAQGSARGQRLRLRLQIEPPDLAALPWEALHDGTTFLSMWSETPLVRRFPMAKDVKASATLTVKPPLRILFVGASPLDPTGKLAEIDVLEAERQLVDALNELQKKRQAQLYRMLNPTLEELKEELARDYHLLVFLGHGDAQDTDTNQKACIYLDGTSSADLKDSPFIRDGLGQRGMREISSSAARVDAGELTSALEGKPTRLIFLAACKTAATTDGQGALLDSFAQVLAQQVPAVVAMQYSIGADQGINLAEFFLRAVAGFRPVDVALAEARNALSGTDQVTRDHFSPVMYLQTESSQIFNAVPLIREALFDGLIKDHRRLFAGRDDELAALRQFMADPEGGYLVVTAPAGFGKTTLMANLVDRDSLANAYHFFNATEAPQSLDPDTYFRNIVEVMAEWHQYRAELPKDVADLKGIYHQLIALPLDRPRTLILNWLDEVPWSEIPWSNFAKMLAEKLPANMHVIITIRDVGQDWEQDILAKFGLPTDQTTRYRMKGLGPEQVKAVFQKAGEQAKTFVEDPAALAEIMRVAAYDPGRPSLGADPFFVAFMADDATKGDLTPDGIATQPTGLESYLGRWLAAIRQSWGPKDKRDQAIFDLFGTLAVAKGPLSRADLEAMNKNLRDDDAGYFDDVLNKVRRLVQGEKDTGYSLLHPRLREPLGKAITTVEKYRSKLLTYCGRWRTTKSRYALIYFARHLAERTQQTSDSAERHRFTEQLVQLVVDPDFQKAHKDRVNDLAALQNDLTRALHAAAQDDDLLGLPLLVESAKALVAIHQNELRPESIFSAAAAGDVDAALRHLGVFSIETDWRQIARLLIAWLAMPTANQAVRDLRDQVLRETPKLKDTLDPSKHDPLRKMLAHLDAALEIAPPPVLLLPIPPHSNEVNRILGSIEDAELDSEMLGRSFNAQVQFLTEQDGLSMVSFANPRRTESDRVFSQYVESLAGYGYTEYRNKSLWYLLDAALHHPNDNWIIDNARMIVSGALGESRVGWRGSLPLTALALQAEAGDPAARVQLQEYIGGVTQEAIFILGHQVKKDDVWGSLRRCLAAIAEAKVCVLAAISEADVSLMHAKQLRRGFAGFKVPAGLNIGEAILVCHPNGTGEMDAEITHAVLSAAHNIQDPVFCARSTARADALIEQLWKTTEPGIDLAQIISEFSKNPNGPDFAALHRIGNGQKYPDRDRHGRYPLPAAMITDVGVTLAILAIEVYHCSPIELQRLNPEYQLDAPLPIDKPMFIRIPDAEFAPWLAARFAAESLAQPGMADDERIRLIRELAPIAAPDPTALDTVLARLLLAAHPLLKMHPERTALIAALATAAGALRQPFEQHK